MPFFTPDELDVMVEATLRSLPAPSIPRNAWRLLVEDWWQMMHAIYWSQPEAWV